MNKSASAKVTSIDWRQETGPLKALLLDTEVSEIMANSWNEIFVERNGRIETAKEHFGSPTNFAQCIQSLCVFAGKEVNRRSPFLDARLPDGSRMNVVVPPVSFGGPVLTIRKAINSLMDYRALIERGALTDKAVYFLNKLVDARQNIVITGASGSGKTTLLSVLTSFVDGAQRLIVVEDTTEVKIQVKNFVRMEVPQVGLGEEEVTMKDLLRNALRMRPDRLIVGECRGSETIDMILAMNTGHEGSMTTIHANSAIDGLTRMESMVLHSGTQLPRSLIQQNIATTIQFVIHADLGPDGKRRLDEVLEIRGWENGNYVTAPIFKWNAKDGLVSTGEVPQIAGEKAVPGVKFPDRFFEPSVKVKFGK